MAEAEAIAEATPEAEAPAEQPAPVEAEAAADVVAAVEAAEAEAAEAEAESAEDAVVPEVTEAPAEPVLIEIWKPHRQHHGRRPGAEQRGRGGPRRAQGGARGEAATGETPAPAEGAQRPRRDDRPEGGKPRFEGKRRFEGKFEGKRRDDAPPSDRPFQGEKRPPREKKADPDSPFAKLAALKAELEAKGRSRQVRGSQVSKGRK